MAYQQLRSGAGFSSAVVAGALLLALAGCGDSPCEELAAICELCPTTGLGPTAKESCLRAVATDDDHTCDEKVEQRSYAVFDCK